MANSASRSISEMVQALRRQLRVLDEHMKKAFVEGNRDYVAEVAAQLRIIAISSGSNRALLVELMKKTHININILLDDTLPGLLPEGYDRSKGISLSQYLQLTTFSTQVSSGELVHLSKENVVRLLAEKLGGAHEDWSLPEPLAIFVNDDIFFNNLHASAAVLKAIAKDIAMMSNRFLVEFEKRVKHTNKN